MVLNGEEVYSFTDAEEKGVVRVSPVEKKLDAYRILKGEIQIKNPLVFTIMKGKRFKDLVPTGHALLYLISQKVVEVLESNKISGWRTFPADIYDNKNKLITGYYGFVIVGRCGIIDKSQSEIIVKTRNTPKGLRKSEYLKGYFFDPNTWDGSDIFSPIGTGHIFLLEKVKKLIEKSGLTYFEFNRIADIERLKFNIKGKE
ncbi:MAG: hypothetical protein KAU17_13555 [Spirochaetales bacterium]|nr:hypothetical protein [Spirochaetales bacterium]